MCELCGGDLEVGQRGRHYTCCADAGGRPDRVCNPTLTKVDGQKAKVTVCAHCWVESTAPAKAAA